MHWLKKKWKCIVGTLLLPSPFILIGIYAYSIGELLILLVTLVIAALLSLMVFFGIYLITDCIEGNNN